MVMTAFPGRDRRATFLADPALASQLARFVRTRVPAHEVDDIVQSTLADALASGNAPENDAELKPWIFGIARNKVADHFRRTRREVPREPAAVDEVAAASAPQSAQDLLHWAQRELPEGEGSESTLEWMLREGAGEKLETIAAEENVPAPRVRQRVARLRKHFRAKWAAQLAAAALLVVLALAIWAVWRTRGNDIAVPEPPRVPSSTPSTPAPLPMPPSPPEQAPALDNAPDAAPPPVTSTKNDSVDTKQKPTPAPTPSFVTPKIDPTATTPVAPPPSPKTGPKPTPPLPKTGGSDSLGSDVKDPLGSKK